MLVPSLKSAAPVATLVSAENIDPVAATVVGRM
jgi:hypothetical protein